MYNGRATSYFLLSALQCYALVLHYCSMIHLMHQKEYRSVCGFSSDIHHQESMDNFPHGKLGQIEMTILLSLDDWVRAPPKLQLLWMFPVCSGRDLPNVFQVRKSRKPATGSWVAKTH